ncbi:MAG: SpoIVB peptidase [Bacteroidales bacterium]|nr:SpoIVB peptidase [Bacteroidales bacterium]MCM1415499.1 SpoIVB peptidase [bacterium]MCM1423436.1 SpoIVB peptidase [bacterium]
MTGQQEKKYRAFLWMLLLTGVTAFFLAAYLSYWDKIPSRIRIRAGVEQEFDFRIPVSGEIYRTGEEAAPVSAVADVSGTDVRTSKKTGNPESIHVDFARTVKLKANQIDTYQMDLKLFGVLPYKNVDIEVIQDKMLIPSGIPIGIYVKTEGVLVVGIGEFESSGGENISPARYVLQKGDYILKSNGETIENKKQFISMVEASEGGDMVLTIRRGGEITDVMVNAEKNQMQEWKLGIWIRDNAQGIGTMTYEDTDDSFGALGHGINDVDTSILMNLEEGVLYRTEIVGITRGAGGAPGELTGYIEYDSDNVIGEITENTVAGIFGVCDHALLENAAYEPVPIALKQEIELGPAQIICSVSGEPEFYDVEIVEVNQEHENVNRGIVIRVVDEKLLMLTGGIIQGMSGSPIIQNGKLAGAVTHVLVNDSTKGYGIFIEEMLSH